MLTIPVCENHSGVFPSVIPSLYMNVDISLGYYDKILAAVAASLGGGALAGMITAVSFHVGLLAGALFSTIFVYDAIFRKPPRPAPSPRAKAVAVIWHVFLGVLLLTTYL